MVLCKISDYPLPLSMDDRGRSLDFPRSPAPPGDPEGRAEAGPVPLFDLYGDTPRDRPDPVHVEPLVTRSARHGWAIRPHRHRALHQVFWIRQGEGSLLGAGGEARFRAPVLHLVPAGQVHGLRFDPASAGHVLTLTDGFLSGCAGLIGAAPMPATIASLSPGRAAVLAGEMDALFGRLEAAFRSLGPAREAALAGHVLLLFSLLRREAEETAGPGEGGARALLVRRFREAVEQHYRSHAALDFYCDRLGVTPSTLTRACRAVTGRSPAALIHERLLAEARRLLRLGSRNVSGVAYALGFEPAYFSRFFQRHEGMSPAAYQRRHGGSS